MAMQRGLRRLVSGVFCGAVTVAFRLAGRYHKVSVYAASIANGGAGLRDLCD
jgi:Na+-translocating ferredoxin:NAD+ oxidoreductase RnfD subunit